MVSPEEIHENFGSAGIIGFGVCNFVSFDVKTRDDRDDERLYWKEEGKKYFSY